MDSKRYRILYIQKPKGGGSATGLYDLLKGLDTRIYEPIVLFYQANFYSAKVQQELGLKVHILDYPSASQILSNTEGSSRLLTPLKQSLATAKRYIEELKLIVRVVAFMKREQIHLVHQNDNLPKDRYTAIAAYLAGIPQICHIRTLEPLNAFERQVAKGVNQFIYMSKAIEKVYLEAGIPADKGEVVYDGFDTHSFNKITPEQIATIRAEFGVSEQDWLITNIGRLDNWKGHDYFLKAIAQVVPTCPTLKALIVGAPEKSPWNQEYYQKLQQLVVDLNLSNHVIFTGFRADIPQILAASDMMVHSASRPEPFGRVIVEGMLAGKPVIATAAGGVLDIIDDHKTGLLVPPGDADSMAIAIQELVNNRSWAQQLGQTAKQTAIERFQTKDFIDSIQQIYKKLLMI